MNNMLNILTNEFTAFSDWAEFEKAMQAGYVPTMMSRKLRKNTSKASKNYEAGVKFFRDTLRDLGFKVFEG